MISYTAFLNESMNRIVLIKSHRGVRGDHTIRQRASTCKGITTGPEFVQ